MNKMVTAIALAIAIPAAAYAQAVPAPAPKPEHADCCANMQDHAECANMHRMMSGMMHGSGQSGHSMMGGSDGQAHQQLMTPDAKAPAASQHQQHQQ